MVYKQQKFLFHSYGSWNSKVPNRLISGENLFPYSELTWKELRFCSWQLFEALPHDIIPSTSVTVCTQSVPEATFISLVHSLVILERLREFLEVGPMGGLVYIVGMPLKGLWDIGLSFSSLSHPALRWPDFLHHRLRAMAPINYGPSPSKLGANPNLLSFQWVVSNYCYFQTSEQTFIQSSLVKPCPALRPWGTCLLSWVGRLLSSDWRMCHMRMWCPSVHSQHTWVPALHYRCCWKTVQTGHQQIHEDHKGASGGGKLMTKQPFNIPQK